MTIKGNLINVEYNTVHIQMLRLVLFTGESSQTIYTSYKIDKDGKNIMPGDLETEKMVKGHDTNDWNIFTEPLWMKTRNNRLVLVWGYQINSEDLKIEIQDQSKENKKSKKVLENNSSETTKLEQNK